MTATIYRIQDELGRDRWVEQTVASTPIQTDTDVSVVEDDLEEARRRR